MQKSITLNKLFKSIQFKTEPSISDFEKCFAHINQYEELPNNKNVGNSRFVFLGQYGFKGLIAEIIFKYIAGNGKQLQQYLGNVFSNEKLEKIFDELHFEHLISFKAGFDFKTQKHIFTAGFLGFLYENATEEYNQAFIFKHFLADSKAIIPKTNSINLIQILQAKAEQIIKQKVKIEYSKEKLNGDNTFIVKVLLNQGEIIGQHASKSEIYAKKKAIKLALDYLLKIESESPIFKSMEARKLSEETRKKNTNKKQIAINHQQFLQEKAEKRKLAVEIKTKEAKEREYNRLLNKKNLKLGEKPKKKLVAKITEVELSTMSANKRQRIQDKLK
jgi:hypothetical protein